MLFRELSDEEVIKFRQWARDNFDPSIQMKEIWHPVVRAEWTRLSNDDDLTKRHYQ